MIFLLCVLILATSGFSQIQILQDVELDSSVSNRHFQRLGEGGEGRVAMWGSHEGYWPMAGYFAVLDTSTGQFIWNEILRDDSAEEEIAAVLDVKTTDSAYVVEWSALIPWDSVGGSFRVSYFDLDGSSSWTQQWLMPERLASLGTMHENRAYFADLNPYGSFAPAGMMTGIDLTTGTIAWENEVLPYMMDNWNGFYSLRMTSEHGLVYVGMSGLPGDGAYFTGMLNPETGHQDHLVPIAHWDSVRVYDAVETTDGDLWTIGITYHSPRQLFLRSYEDSERVFLPFFSDADTCFFDALCPHANGGILGAVHTELGATVIRVPEAMTTWWPEAGAEEVYSRMLDIIPHPSGGYLALALDYASPPRYHLVRFTVTDQSADDLAFYPSAFTLSAYPNPFNAATQISFTLPQSGIVSLVLYDILGRKVGELVNGRLAAGPHTIRYSAEQLSSGIHFARLETVTGTVTQKLVILK